MPGRGYFFSVLSSAAAKYLGPGKTLLDDITSSASLRGVCTCKGRVFFPI
jgi:hypothetical protein